jgi:hypothetical protein
MRKHLSFRPTALSPLEDRLALSHVGTAPAALVHHIHRSASLTPPSHVLGLNGTISGTFVTRIGNAGNVTASTTTTFTGSGMIKGIGDVKVSGTLSRTVTPTGQPIVFESFTITTATGSVTLQLTNPVSKPSNPPTLESKFSIVKATGAFQGDTGTGVADLQLFTEAINTVPPVVAKGNFTLTLRSGTGIV